MDVLKFIKCVQQRDCIYNKNSADYRQRDVVFDSWRSIAREMNISGEFTVLVIARCPLIESSL